MTIISSGTGCEVWWAAVSDVHPDHLGLLDEVELARWHRFRRPEDRDRLVVGAILARSVAAARIGCRAADVRLDRTCRCGQPHGKPRVIGAERVELSISHAGSWVAVAVYQGAAVGIDVERIDRTLDLAPMIDSVFSPDERRSRPPTWSPDHAEFFEIWSRKEAVLKATGDGLRVPLSDLTISTPQVSLSGWRGRPGLADQVWLADLRAPTGYVASLAVLGSGPVEVRERDGSPLLRELREGGADRTGGC